MSFGTLQKFSFPLRCCLHGAALHRSGCAPWSRSSVGRSCSVLAFSWAVAGGGGAFFRAGWASPLDRLWSLWCSFLGSLCPVRSAVCPKAGTFRGWWKSGWRGRDLGTSGASLVGLNYFSECSRSAGRSGRWPTHSKIWFEVGLHFKF